MSATNVMPNLNIIASSESPSSPTTTLNNSVQAEPIQKNQLTDSNAKVLSSSSPSSSSTVITTKIDVPEKKRKSVSSSRQKKFHRHFQQVSSDEPVLNCNCHVFILLRFSFFLQQLKSFVVFFFRLLDFSCALVSDILLQGYLYITENYFAFYSNVFGYVTKLLIPVTSVTKISKEKTVKIFPNAIAVGTVDERHVFSSFLSRETAYQLMISIWQDAVIHRQFQSSAATNNIATASNLLQIACATINGTSSSASTDTLAQRVENDENGEAADVTITTTRIENTVGTNSPKYCRQNNDGLLEISELEDDSSSAISGSESLTKRLLAQTLAQQHPLTQTQQEDVQNPTIHDDWNSSFARQSATLPLPNFQWVCAVLARWYSNICKWQSKIPQTVPAIYFGLSLIIILSLMALLLFCRIHELRSPKIPTFSVENIDEVSLSDEQSAEKSTLFKIVCTFFFSEFTIQFGNVFRSLEMAGKDAIRENKIDTKCFKCKFRSNIESKFLQFTKTKN